MDPVPPPPPPMESANSDIIAPTNAKDPVVVLLVALFFGAVAYFLIGQWQKGIAGVVAWLSAIVFAFITCGIGFLIYFPLVVAFVIDSYMQADLLKKGTAIRQWTFFGQHA